MSTYNIYWPQKEMSTSHLCEFSPNDCKFFYSIILLQEIWLFNNAMHQKEIHLMHIYGKDNATSTSTHITKVT